MSRGKFCKDWECFYPNLYEYPLDSQKFKKHACGRGAGKVLFPAPLPRGERRRRQKEFVVLGKIDETTNYANLNWYDAKVFSTNYGHNQAHALRPSPCSKTKVRQAEAVFMHSRPTP